MEIQNEATRHVSLIRRTQALQREGPREKVPHKIWVVTGRVGRAEGKESRSQRVVVQSFHRGEYAFAFYADRDYGRHHRRPEATNLNLFL